MDPILIELFKYGPAMGLLAIAVWALWGGSKDDKKALLDIYAKTVIDTTSSIKDNTTAWQNAAKTDEMVVKSLDELSRRMDRVEMAIGNSK